MHQTLTLICNRWLLLLFPMHQWSGTVPRQWQTLGPPMVCQNAALAMISLYGHGRSQYERREKEVVEQDWGVTNALEQINELLVATVNIMNDYQVVRHRLRCKHKLSY